MNRSRTPVAVEVDPRRFAGVVEGMQLRALAEQRAYEGRLASIKTRLGARAPNHGSRSVRLKDDALAFIDEQAHMIVRLQDELVEALHG